MTLRIIQPAKKTAISDDENDTSYVCRIEYGSVGVSHRNDGKLKKHRFCRFWPFLSLLRKVHLRL